MCADKHDHQPGLVWSVLRNKCPRCRRGDMFSYRNPYDLKRFMKMPETCPVCGQPFEIEVGFYYGTSFVSYALAVAVSVASFIAWKVLIGMSLNDNRLFWWLGVNAVLLVVVQPLLMRLSRAIWIYFFVRYDPEWRNVPVGVPERMNEELRNGW
ncbi:MAG TPA: DUF983 domain-containing protein [Puia sp.]|nr:DUF983 domain-containing protein [Puia sp.]